jgi:hypothetical protein
MNLTKFVISDTQYLKITPQCIHADDCEVCAEVDIDYVDETKNICLRIGNEPFCSFSRSIAKAKRIQKLIKGEMVLDPSIPNDLGIQCNQFFSGRQKENLFMQYHFLSNDHKQIRPYFNGWLYNDKNGKIIFEITPFYPYVYETKKSHPDFITYKKFMKQYQPTIKTIISKKNLQQWIKQAQELVKIHFPQFYKNAKRVKLD